MLTPGKKQTEDTRIIWVPASRESNWYGIAAINCCASRFTDSSNRMSCSYCVFGGISSKEDKPTQIKITLITHKDDHVLVSKIRLLGHSFITTINGDICECVDGTACLNSVHVHKRLLGFATSASWMSALLLCKYLCFYHKQHCFWQQLNPSTDRLLCILWQHECRLARISELFLSKLMWWRFAVALQTICT